MLNQVFYTGNHRKTEVIVQWRPTGKPVWRWSVLVIAGNGKRLERLVSCPPSWKASTRLADEVLPQSKTRIKRVRSKVNLNVVG